MITEYHRPSTLESALELLGRKTPITVPLAGGIFLDRKSEQSFAVVDIQDLSLKEIIKDGISLRLGAAVTLQELIDHPDIPSVLKEACRKESNYNHRQMATLGGCVASGNGRSILLAVLLTLNSQVEIQPGNVTVSVGEILPLRRQFLSKKLITAITINTISRVSFETISKTPGDRSIAGVSVAQWPNGRTRVCVFGFGDYPITAMDGPTVAGAEIAAKNAFAESGDINASTSYRQDLAEILVKRCLDKQSGGAL